MSRHASRRRGVVVDDAGRLHAIAAQDVCLKYAARTAVGRSPGARYDAAPLAAALPAILPTAGGADLHARKTVAARRRLCQAKKNERESGLGLEYDT